MAESRLPATFTSLYRLFLRASSASVLHHTVATRNLRRLWRPTFDGAATVAKRLHVSQDVTERSRLRDWLNTWEKRSELASLVELRPMISILSGWHIGFAVQLSHVSWAAAQTDEEPLLPVPQ